MLKKRCEQCGGEFEVYPYEKDTRRFCSRECYKKWTMSDNNDNRGENHPSWQGGKIAKICDQCGGEYEVYPHRQGSQFCSIECHNKWMSENLRGENGPGWKGGKVVKICEQCGRDFKVPTSRKDNARFCSCKCNYDWQSDNLCGENRYNHKTKIKLICEQCGSEFEINPSKKDRSRFCSIECRGMWQSEHQSGENNPCWKDKITKVCEQCGREFKVAPSRSNRQRFCSRECKDEGHSGENHTGWKGGISFEPYCHKFNEAFKESIREKFGRVCFLCPTTEEENGKKLSVHHTTYNKDCLCDDSDCEFVPLCMRCHSKTNFNRDYWESIIMEKLEVML